MEKHKAEFVGFALLVLIFAAVSVLLNVISGTAFTWSLALSAACVSLLLSCAAVVLANLFGKRLGDILAFTSAFIVANVLTVAFLLWSEFQAIDAIALVATAITAAVPALLASVSTRLITRKDS
jgi:hypothetical protein